VGGRENAWFLFLARASEKRKRFRATFLWRKERTPLTIRFAQKEDGETFHTTRGRKELAKLLIELMDDTAPERGETASIFTRRKKK